MYAVLSPFFLEKREHCKILKQNDIIDTTQGVKTNWNMIYWRNIFFYPKNGHSVLFLERCVMALSPLIRARPTIILRGILHNYLCINTALHMREDCRSGALCSIS